MSLFYAFAYLLRPWRVFKAVSNLITGKEGPRLDLALHNIKDRLLARKDAAS
jgi:hypothetical protein